MADKATLKASIRQAFEDQRNKTGNWEDVLDDLSDKISAAVDAYAKSLTIVYMEGLAAPGGPITGTFKGELT